MDVRENRLNNNKTNKLSWHLAYKFLLVLGLLLLTQLLFFVCNTRIFHIGSFGEAMSVLWGNIRFGLASTALFLTPYLVMMLLPVKVRWNRKYQIVAEVLFWLGALALLIVNIVDVAYYQFTYRRMNAMMFRYMGVGGEMGNLLPRFVVDYWYATLSAIVTVTLLAWGCVRLRLRNMEGWTSATTEQPKRRRRSRLSHETWSSILGLLLLFVLLRGGVERQWIQPGETLRYAQPKNSALVINSAYNIVRTIGHLDAQEHHYMSPALAKNIYNTDYEPTLSMLNEHTTLADASAILSRHPEVLLQTLLQVAGRQMGADSSLAVMIDSLQRNAPQPKNVVVIVLESFSQEYMGCYNHGSMKSFTPFLDELSRQSLCYQGRSNGKESIESIPAIFASLPSWSLSPFILSPYYKDSIAGLPAILKRHGYQSSFFHGSYNGTMNFDKFCAKAGFDRYYGKDEYIETHGDAAYDGAWGIFDEPFMQYTVEEISKMREPFCAAAFTISSHHPYGLPKGMENTFPEGEHKILRTVAYTDYALRRFFEAASKQPWYTNTLFVIMGDHPGQALSRAYNDYQGWYRIPMMFFDPSNPKQAAMSNDIVQQIDVMPTLLDMLNIQEQVVCFGQSALHHSGSNRGWHVVFGNDYYQLERNGRIAILSPYKSIGAAEDIEFLKAVIQTYDNKLINNLLVRNTQ